MFKANETILQKRKKLWEIDDWLFCSICGTCLSIELQKLVLKKHVKDKKNYTDFEIHAFMINSAKSMNKISLSLNKILDKIYKEEIEKYTYIGSKEFKQLWQEKLMTGDICGLYWVAVSSPIISDELLIDLYHEVHMLSHLNGGRVREERKRINKLTQEKLLLKQGIKQLEEEKSTLQKDLNTYLRKTNDLEKEINEHSKDWDFKNEILVSQEKNSDYISEINSLVNKIADLKAENEIINNENKLLNSEIKNYKHFLNTYNDLSSKSFSFTEICEADQCLNNICCSSNDCSKKVLLVGGLTKLKNYYENIIESKGMKLVYHDGYMRNGEKKLKELIRNSDVVLCSVDINSHTACLSTKKICKTLNKQCYFLNSSSLTSIERNIDNIISKVRLEGELVDGYNGN